jgi:hypothetical protein
MKIIRKIGDGLYRLTDSFFQVPSAGLSENPDINLNPDQTACMVWELNQGVEDIVLKDLSVSLNILIPSFIRKPVKQLYKKACLYFLVDAIIEEESLDPVHFTGTEASILAEPAGKKFTLFADVKRKAIYNVISLGDWIKIKLHRVGGFIRLLQPAKPYYLLGNFAPTGSDIYNDNSDFSPTYIFHLRN